MGRHDAYSYHSEAGRADGTPGGSDKSSREERKSLCPVCKEQKEGVVERSGDFAGEVMCYDCLSQKQEEKEEEEKRAVLKKIRGEDE